MMESIGMIVWALACIVVGFAAGFDKGRSRERSGLLIYKVMGSVVSRFGIEGTVLTIDGHPVVLRPGDVLEVRIWKNEKGGGPIDTDPNSLTYDDPATFAPSKL